MTDFRSRSLSWVVLRVDLILVLVAGFAISFGILTVKVVLLAVSSSSFAVVVVMKKMAD